MIPTENYRFLFEGHRQLLTSNEAVAWNNIKVQRLIDQCDYPTVTQLFRDRWLSTDPAILQLLENGSDAFYAATLARIETETPAALNTCPQCHTLCRTSRAHLCPSCSHSWFEKR